MLKLETWSRALEALEASGGQGNSLSGDVYEKSMFYLPTDRLTDSLCFNTQKWSTNCLPRLLLSASYCNYSDPLRVKNKTVCWQPPCNMNLTRWVKQLNIPTALQGRNSLVYHTLGCKHISLCSIHWTGGKQWEKKSPLVSPGGLSATNISLSLSSVLTDDRITQHWQQGGGGGLWKTRFV